MSDELKPCPFCGGEAKIHKQPGGSGYIACYIKCTECGAKTQTMENSQRENKTPAINAWNRRTNGH